jgi:hypothetical protein
VLAGLLVAAAFAGEVPHELVGLKQEQVIRRLGEPRSQMQAGNRLVMLYPRERITLRDGVVVDVEVFAAEPARRPTVPAPSPAPVVAVPVAPPLPAAPAVFPPSVAPGVVAPPTPAPAAPTVGPQGPVPGPGPATAPAPAGAPPTPATAMPSARPELPLTSEPESRLGIKLVRPPSARDSGAAPPPPSSSPATPETQSPAPAAVADPRAATPPPSAVRPPVAATASSPAAPAAPIPAATAPPPAPPASFTALPAESPREIAERAMRGAAPTKKAEPPADRRKDTFSSKLLRDRLDRAQATATEESGFPWIAVGIGVAVLAAGVGFLVLYRRRSGGADQPVPATVRDVAPSGLGGIGAARDRTSFTTATLAKLEWKRFQEVVEAYYYKTGVVALRTRAGPQSPVHIKISWKGEARPFACVRCISQARGPIGPVPLEELLAVLDAEKIRRGYVVTSGVFNAAARELAERKQLTLMSGETLREKLNALPESARAELMQLAQEGDPTVPSCPVCDSKMSLSRENPPVWRCASHPDQSFPAES